MNNRKNEFGMEKFSKKFIKENAAIICMGPAFLILLAALSSIYAVQTEYVIYLTIIYTLLWGIVLCVQYRSYRRKTKQQEKELNETEGGGQKENRRWEEMQEKQDFFALWAHQIKTPIAALNLLLQAEKQDIAACRQELFKIETYVEMALNYLRFEDMSNDLVLERNSLEKLVRQVVKKYATIFIYNHISIQLEHLDYTVLTDEKWFCFVLEQILSNALK